MFIDLSLPISIAEISGGEEFVRKIVDAGHAGTHFDVMDKEFPLDSFRTTGKVVDVSLIRDREIQIEDIGGVEFHRGDTIIFYTGWVDALGYDTSSDYVHKSAELSDSLVEHIVKKGVKLIGVDAAGAQKPSKHAQVDRYCADRGVFIIDESQQRQEACRARSAVYGLRGACPSH